MVEMGIKAFGMARQASHSSSGHRQENEIPTHQSWGLTDWKDNLFKPKSDTFKNRIKSK